MITKCSDSIQLHLRRRREELCHRTNRWISSRWLYLVRRSRRIFDRLRLPRRNQDHRSAIWSFKDSHSWKEPWPSKFSHLATSNPFALSLFWSSYSLKEVLKLKWVKSFSPSCTWSCPRLWHLCSLDREVHFSARYSAQLTGHIILTVLTSSW